MLSKKIEVKKLDMIKKNENNLIKFLYVINAKKILKNMNYL